MRAAITPIAFVAAHALFVPATGVAHAVQDQQVIFAPGTGVGNIAPSAPNSVTDWPSVPPVPAQSAAAASPATVSITPAEDPVLQTGLISPGRLALRAAVRACEAWIFEPASWASGIDKFIAKAGLSGRIEQQQGVPAFALPPVEWRRGNHYWLAKGRANEGYYVTVSDLSPVCHITGLSPNDLYADIMAEFEGNAFLSKWQLVSATEKGAIHTNNYASRMNEQFNMIASWANAAGGPTDRIQFIASMQFEIRK